MHDFDRYSLAVEAQKMIESGENPLDLAHVLWLPDGTLNGLSSTITSQEWLDGGYTGRYQTLHQWANY